MSYSYYLRSIGLMSNFQLPVKFPCSVYSVAMLLAHKVNFWDAGPEAIGEDMHMALKCWTATKMTLRLTPIYLPASCSNVQADTYFGSVNARFQQSKRHLWGALDFGYASARLITQGCWRSNFVKSALCIYLLFEIFFQPYFGFYHLAGQLIFPQSLVGMGSFVIEYTTYIRLALLPPAIIVAIAYERYHYVASSYREKILLAIAAKKKADGIEDALEGIEDVVAMDEIPVSAVASGYGQSSVAFRQWYNVLDWIGLPFCLVFYYMIPGVNAMIWQMFTNKLDYKVSLKPTTRKGPEAEKEKVENENNYAHALQINTSSATLHITDDQRSVDGTSDVSSYASIGGGDDSDELSPGAKELRNSKTQEFVQKIRSRGHQPRDSAVDLEILVDDGTPVSP